MSAPLNGTRSTRPGSSPTCATSSCAHRQANSWTTGPALSASNPRGLPGGVRDRPQAAGSTRAAAGHPPDRRRSDIPDPSRRPDGRRLPASLTSDDPGDAVRVGVCSHAGASHRVDHRAPAIPSGGVRCPGLVRGEGISGCCADAKGVSGGGVPRIHGFGRPRDLWRSRC